MNDSFRKRFQKHRSYSLQKGSGVNRLLPIIIFKRQNNNNLVSWGTQTVGFPLPFSHSPSKKGDVRSWLCSDWAGHPCLSASARSCKALSMLSIQSALHTCMHALSPSVNMYQGPALCQGLFQAMNKWRSQLFFFLLYWFIFYSVIWAAAQKPSLNSSVCRWDAGCVAKGIQEKVW